MAQRMAEQDPQDTVRQLNRIQAMIGEASEQMHNLILGLRLYALDDLGLGDGPTSAGQA
jgi:signal transduction histidine kinase